MSEHEDASSPRGIAKTVAQIPSNRGEGFDVAKTVPQVRAEFVINHRYRVLNSLGEGGFATVYRGIDENLKREVAVKIMRPELLGEEHQMGFLKRFEREALIVARLDHPHLAPVFETGVTVHEGQETAFIVMKYLQGYDLDDILYNDGPLSPERAHRVILQTLEALAYIHTKGVVHKDLKPSNIFLCEDHLGRDHVYLMDFGIAHDTQDAQGRLTNTGMLTGTFQYLPPEYVLLQEAKPSVDVFQMGLIIVELLTGEPMIDDEQSLPQIVARYLKSTPFVLPPEFEGTRLAQVIDKALQFDTSKRYADAGELYEALAALTPADYPVFGEAREAFKQPSASLEFIPQESQTAPEVAAPEPTPEPVVEQTAYEQADATERLPVAVHVEQRPPGSAVTSIGAATPSQDNQRLYLVAGILLLAVVGAGLLIVILADDLRKGGSPPAEVGNTATSAEPSKPAADTKPVVEKAPSEPAEKPPAEPELVSFSLETTPAGARVSIGGVDRGITPTTVEIEKADGEIELVLELEGHVSHTRTLDASKGVSLIVTLEKSAPVASSKPKTKPRKKGSTPKKSGASKKPVEKKPVAEPAEKKPVEKKPKEDARPSIILPGAN